MAKHYLYITRVLYGELKERRKTYSSLLDLKTKEEVVAAGGVLASQLLETGAVEEGALQEQIDWKKSIKKYTIECLECGALFKQLSVRHLREHDLDARTYRTKNGIPKTQPLSAKDTTAMHKKIVQKSRPWEKAPTYMKAHGRKAANGAAKGRAKRQAAAASA